MFISACGAVTSVVMKGYDFGQVGGNGGHERVYYIDTTVVEMRGHSFPTRSQTTDL